jgi:hypothetical protein
MPNILGETADPNLSGVFGHNTGQGGVGVTGISTSGDGVRAVSTSGNGLSAFSDNSTAVFAKAKTQPGVSSISDSNDGVRAVSTSGNGLSAFSDKGTGVFSKGAVNAGFFEGNVTITGHLTVRGAAIGPEFVQQVGNLQQQLSTTNQLLNNLQQQLSNLQQKEAADVQGIAISLVTLATRISNLGG